MKAVFCFTAGDNVEGGRSDTSSNVSDWLEQSEVLNKNKLGDIQWESMHCGQNLIKTHGEQHPAFMSACIIVVHRNKQFSLGEEMGQRTMRGLHTISLCAACTNYTLL